jgi:lysophospholipase L1-like esterase
MLARGLPAAHVTVLNRGRGGQAIAEMLARLERDVLAAQPTMVIWQAGTNDAIRNADPEVFRAGMEAGMALIRAAGADIVLMDSQRGPRVLAAPATPAFDSLLERLAVDQRAGLFSRAALMRRWQADGTPFAAMLSPDGLHHNDRGYHCVSQALARSILAAVRPPAVVAGR